MKTLIIGGSNELHFLIDAFINKGHQVILMNSDPSICATMNRAFSILAIQGDGTLPTYYEGLRLTKEDTLIALHKKDQDNYVACTMARHLLSIDRSLTIVTNPDFIERFKALGISVVLNTASIIASLIEEKIFPKDVKYLMSIGSKNIAMIEIELVKKDAACGKNISQIPFREEMIVTCIIREDTLCIPKGQTLLKAKDRLLILCQHHSKALVTSILKEGKGGL